MIEIIGNPKLDTKSSIKQIAENCVKKLGLDSDKIIEIIFVDQKKIQELNHLHRKINKPTDVLSFPQNDIKTVKQILGSIVICEEIAKKLDESDAALVQHGFLHLLGHDHEKNLKDWNNAEKLLIF